MVTTELKPHTIVRTTEPRLIRPKVGVDTGGIYNDISALSTTIGVVSMAAIAVTMAAVVMSYLTGYRSSLAIPPISAFDLIQDMPNSILIILTGGDVLENGSWWISVVPFGKSPVYRQSSTNFLVGDMMTVQITTDGTGQYTVTKNGITSDGTVYTLISNTTYEIRIINKPTKTDVLLGYHKVW